MLNLAIVGLGKWGARLVAAVQGQSYLARFTTVVTRDPGRIAEQVAAFDLVPLPDLDAALHDPAIDGIVLATPHSLHATQIAACAAAGKPVFVEKPFTLDRASAEWALSGAPEDLVIAAGHNRRFLPAVAELKTEISGGMLGKILFVESNFSGNVASTYHPDQWRVASAESPAGGMAGAGIHMIDLIIHLVAPIRSVTAQSRRQVLDLPIDDTTSATFVLEDGAGAVLTTLMATAPTFGFKVFGTKGTAELAGQEQLVITDMSGARETWQFEPVDIERAEIDAFARAIAGTAPYPVSRAEILNGVAAFDAVAKSAASGESVIL